MRRAILLPNFFVTYSLAYLDRANFGFGAAAGMSRTLHITDGQLAWLGGMFFLGYFLFQIPGMLLARRVSARRVSSSSRSSSGACWPRSPACCTASSSCV